MRVTVIAVVFIVIIKAKQDFCLQFFCSQRYEFQLTEQNFRGTDTASVQLFESWKRFMGSKPQPDDKHKPTPRFPEKSQDMSSFPIVLQAVVYALFLVTHKVLFFKSLQILKNTRHLFQN
ncbi:MAG: hypothetical protein MR432_04810, partial [Prevotellaceae bacterium]|nr:hypothetical protein [Prevotellaceae bacterium]